MGQGVTPARGDGGVTVASRPASAPASNRRALLALPAVVVGLSAVGAVTGAPSLCPVAVVTGTACPGCGLTRAIVALARGDVGASWASHPLGGVIALQIVVAATWWTVSQVRRVPLPRPNVVAGVLAATAVAAVCVWGLRMSNGTLPLV